MHEKMFASFHSLYDLRTFLVFELAEILCTNVVYNINKRFTIKQTGDASRVEQRSCA